MPDDFATVRAKGTWTLQKRSAFREQVKQGAVSLPYELENLADFMENAQVGRTLRYELSEAAALSLLADFNIPWVKKLKEIPHSRRVELAEALRERS